MPNKPTVCIIYGFCEGPAHGKRLRSALEQAGYAVTNKPRTADILITHSGGCFLLPTTILAQQIIHIGPAFWPGRSLRSSIIRKVTADLQAHYQQRTLRFLVYKTAWNVLYFWRVPRHVAMLRGRKRGRLWEYGAITTVIRPTNDTFCTPDLSVLPFNTPATYSHVTGQHDDCWHHPTSYITIVKS